MIHLYIGDGKGKTTAAVGQAIRALGWNKRVLFAQFLKSLDSGEIQVMKTLDNLALFRPEMRHKGFIWNMDERSLAETREDLRSGFFKLIEAAKENGNAMIVMDEILDVVACNFLSENELTNFMSAIDGETELVLTGRSASDKLKAYAHYITCFSKEKHPFDSGIPARKGIEY